MTDILREESAADPDEGAYYPLPIDKLIYVVGKQVDFDIFLRKDRPGPQGPEYFLFFSKGGVFEPWSLMKTKYSGTRMVYYHQRDRVKVIEYLHRSCENGRPGSACSLESRGGFPPLLNGDLRVAKIPMNLFESDDYLQVRVSSLLTDWEVPFDVYLKTRILGKDQPEYLLICPKGETFTARLVEKIQSKGIENVYVHRHHQDQLLQYLYHNLSGILADQDLGPAQKAARIYEVTLVWARQFFEEGEKKLTVRIRLGLEFVNNLFDCLHEDQDNQNWLLAILRHEGKLYTHSLNCCLLGLAFTNYLGWPPKKICDFALGALLHDIGMTKVPQTVMRKPARLTKEEMELVKMHPATGISLLALSNLSRDSLVPVLQHHEHCNGTGYPDGLVQALIEPAGRVMRIVDSFEALTSRRPWREPFEPLEALWIMRQEWQQSGIFDADILSAFIKFLADD